MQANSGLSGLSFINSLLPTTNLWNFVNLSSYFNIIAISADNSACFGIGGDSSGDFYSGNEIGTSATWDGVDFVIGGYTVDSSSITASATETQAGNDDQSEVQVISFTGAPTEGTYTITVDGQTTAGIAWNADADLVQEAMNTALYPGSVSVGGSLPINFTVTFGGTLANTPIDLMTIDMTGTTRLVTLGNNVVQCQGQTISVEAGQCDYLFMLGSGVNGAQEDQVFTINYSDSSTDTFTQSMNDWAYGARYPNEVVVAESTHRNHTDGNTDDADAYIYGYQIPVNRAKIVTGITLPDNPFVIIMSFSEVGVINNIVAWYNANTLDLSNGDPVSTWTDQSGNNYNAVQETTENQPLFATGVLNNFPALQFNGSNWFSTTVAANGNNYSVFVVCQQVAATNSPSDFRVALSWGPGSYGTYWTGYLYNPSLPDETGDLVVCSDSTNDIYDTSSNQDTYWHITEGVHLGNTLTGYDNQTVIGSSDASSYARGNGLLIGGYPTDGVSYQWNGYIAEIILVGAAVSTGDRQVIETYIINKYSAESD